MLGLAKVAKSAVEMTASSLPFDAARIVALVFDDNGDVQVHIVADNAAERVLGVLTGDGVMGATVAAADLAMGGSGEYPAAPMEMMK